MCRRFVGAILVGVAVLWWLPGLAALSTMGVSNLITIPLCVFMPTLAVGGLGFVLLNSAKGSTMSGDGIWKVGSALLHGLGELLFGLLLAFFWPVLFMWAILYGSAKAGEEDGRRIREGKPPRFGPFFDPNNPYGANWWKK